MRMLRRLVPLAVAVCAAAGASVADAASGPAALTLRLADLAPGYFPLGGCDQDSLEYYAPKGRFRPQPGCVIEFVRAWTAPGVAPGPGTVLSAAVTYQRAAAPRAALREPDAFASVVFDPAPEDFEVVAPAPAIGDEAVLLRVVDGSYAVVWRSGSTLAAVLAGRSLIGRRRDTADVDLRAATLQLAAAQQARIATPTPLRRADNDASEVAFDDPGLDLPIWWLGRKLPQRGALPALRFGGGMPAGIFGSDRDLGPILFYGRRDSRAEVLIVLAQPEILHRPALRRDLRRMRRDRCNLIRRLTLRRGRATIFQRSPRCPKLDVRKTADAFADTNAVVVLPGVVALVSADECVSCSGPVSRYESIAGMRRIVRALRQREPRDPATP
ncbi:MAG TPA: hypothetical protein VF250_07140 [Conexibacter sp.]